MKRATVSVVALALVAVSLTVIAQQPAAQQASRAPSASAYFPERFDWQHRKPEEVGMRSALVDQAVQTAIATENPAPKNMVLFLNGSFNKEPFNTIIGPIKDRGPASGLITRHGYIVAEWGDPKRVDITNSVTKTFLTTVVGLA